MSNKLKLVLDFIAYTAANTSNNTSQDATKIKSTVEEADFTALGRKQFSVPDGTNDLAIELDSEEYEYLIVFTTENIKLELNDSGYEQELNAKASGVKTPVLYIRGPIEAMSISNISGQTAKLDIILVN